MTGVVGVRQNGGSRVEARAAQRAGSQLVLGPLHPDTVNILRNLVSMLFHAKDDAGKKATATRYPATLAKLMAELAHGKDK